MSEAAQLASSASPFVVCVGQNLWRLAQAVIAFNYNVVVTIFSLIREGCQALLIIVLALGKACADICFYVVDILWEFAHFLSFCADLLAKVVAVILHGIVELCHVFAEAAVYVLSAALTGLRAAWDQMYILLDKTGVTSISSASVIDSLRILISHVCDYSKTAFDWLCLLILSSASSTGGYVLVLSKQACAFCCSVVVLVFTPVATFVHYLVHVGNYTLSSTVNFATKASEQTFEYLHFYSSQTGIYLKVAVFVMFTFALRMFIAALSKRGLTVPFFSPPQTVIQLDTQTDLTDVIEISEEEEEEVISDEEEESDTQGSGTTYTDDSEYDVEEYSVVDEDEIEISDTDDGNDENDPNAINVQLPQRNGHYGLRERSMPSQVPSSSKLSPDELRKRLDHERDKRLCVVCQDQSKSVLVLPCRHMCMCVDCGHEIAGARTRQQRICPLCRTPIETIMNVYL